MVHCGYDPSGALGTNYQSGDNWKNIKYNFGAKPKPVRYSPELEKRAYNGVTIGKGHLAEAKAVVSSPAAGAHGAFSRKSDDPGQNGNGHEAHVGTFCGGEGDPSQGNGMPAMSKEAKKIEARPE